MALGRTLLARATLLVAVAVVFGPGTLGGFVWDDHSLITNNARLYGVEHLGELLSRGFWDTSNLVDTGSQYFRPVVLLAYFAELQAFGRSPFGFHVVNLLLHAGCVLLLFDVLRRRVGGEALNSPAAIAAGGVGAVLFALHPARTESVTWISGSTDLWMALFCLIGVRIAGRPLSVVRTVALAVVCALALLSKESAVVLPVLLALDALLLTAPGAPRRRSLRAAAVATVAMGATLAVRLAFVPLPATSADAILRGLPARVASSFGHYLLATFWPFAPTVLRGKSALGPDGVLVFEPGSVIAGCAGFAVVLLLALAAVRRPRLRPWLADTAWFCIGLAPVINLVPMQLKALVADRFLYLPMIGVAALAARAVYAFWPRSSPRSRLGLGAVTTAMCLSFGAVVLAHGRVFANDVALWAYELELDPERPMVLEQNAGFALSRGDSALAIALAHAGYELSRRDGLGGLEMRFVLLAVEAELRATPDLEQDRLRAIRNFYDTLAADGRATLALAPLRAGDREIAPALSLEVHFDAMQRKLLSQQHSAFGLQRVRAHARTLDLERATQLLNDLLRAEPGFSEGFAELAILQARMRDFEAAQRSAARAQALSPASPFVSGVVRALAAARRAAAQPAQDEIEQAMQQAQLDLLLGAPGQARARLRPLLAQHPRNAPLIALRARIDAFDRRVDLARARIEAAQRSLPDAGAAWHALLAEFASLR